MKIQGIDNIKATSKKATLTLPQRSPEVKLVVAGLPYGVENTFNEMWPEPPLRFKTVQGKGQTRQEPILSDPQRDKEIEQRVVALTAFRFYLALGADDRVTFDTIPTNKETLLALIEEIKDSGFSAGEVMMVLNTSTKLSSLDDETWDNLENFIA